MQIVKVLCEYRINPVGLGAAKPRFSWELEAGERGARQTAYRIQVKEAAACGETVWEPLLWDSGWVHSDRSVQVAYGGPALRSGTRYQARIRVRDRHDQTSDWYDGVSWVTGLLSPSEWSAEWITGDEGGNAEDSEPITLLRRTFQARLPIQEAILHATALGLYELELNGRRVGTELFTPGWTSYSHRLQTQTYDVTGLLEQGNNAIGAMLGDGWYAGDLGWKNARHLYGSHRALLLQLDIRYADGTTDRMTSDGEWTQQTGPVLYSQLYHGEDYDARLERPGWSTPGYAEDGWLPVRVIDHNKSILVCQENAPVRVTETVRPVSILHTPKGETVLDFGQNMVGWVQFTVTGAAGDEVVLEHAEVLDREGNFYTGNLRSARQRIRYTVRGGGEPETYEPRFTFQGFRYVKVVKYPGDIRPENFTGKVIHTDLELTGEFECSHPLVNQLQRNIVWGQRGNFLDVPTDCPQRDERLGWTGDAQVFIRTAAYNMQVGPMFTKWLHDLKADQHPDGGVPFVIPDVPGLMNAHSSSAWGDAAVICPWTLYLIYEDIRFLEEQYGSMKAWVDYIRSQGNEPHLWNTGFHFGDWLGLDAPQGSCTGITPKDLIATAFFAYSARLVSQAACVLGRTADAQHYGDLAGQVAAHFREEFITPSGRVSSPTQTAHVLTLMFELVEGEVRTRVIRDLARLIRENGSKLTTGFVGTPYLCHVLSQNGELELAYSLLTQEQYPSWLYSVRQGATTIWEHWDGIKEDGSFWSDAMNSYNHYAYGSIGDWMYRVAAGIDLDEHTPGYKHIRIRPQPGGGLSFVKAKYRSMYGTVSSGWRRNDGTMEVTVHIPPNTTATVYLPGARLEGLTESGTDIRHAEDFPDIEETPEEVRLEVGSGSYTFVYPCA